MHYFQEYFTIFVSLTIAPGAPFSIFLKKKNIRKGGRREERDGSNEANACGAKSYVSDLIEKEKGESNSILKSEKPNPKG
jgi:hypothetical protein